MILRPLDYDGTHVPNAGTAHVEKMATAFPTGDGYAPAWLAVAKMQAANATRFLLVGQPDHAQLAGQLAAAFKAEFLPEISEQVAQAIAVHDNGWSQFPFERDLSTEPPLDEAGRPTSFLQVTVKDSLPAWKGSIEAAGAVSSLGEYMVSGHFYRLGKLRLQMKMDSPEDTKEVAKFVEEEENRQQRLTAATAMKANELASYIDLLQFCDTLSLYLCCGAAVAAEFPQDFRGTKVRIRHVDGVFVTTPSVFADTPHRFSIPVRLYPSSNGQSLTRIGFHVK